jgi:hypothetical protein
MQILAKLQYLEKEFFLPNRETVALFCSRTIYLHTDSYNPNPDNVNEI